MLRRCKEESTGLTTLSCQPDAIASASIDVFCVAVYRRVELKSLEYDTISDSMRAVQVCIRISMVHDF